MFESFLPRNNEADIESNSIPEIIQCPQDFSGTENLDDVSTGPTESDLYIKNVFLTKAQCLKITQNVAFEFFNFGIFNQFLTY